MSLPSALSRSARPPAAEADLPDLHAAHLAEMAQAFTRLADSLPLDIGLAGGGTPAGILPAAATAVPADAAVPPAPDPRPDLGAAAAAGAEQPPTGAADTAAPISEAPGGSLTEPPPEPPAESPDAGPAAEPAGDATAPATMADGAPGSDPATASDPQDADGTGGEPPPAPAAEPPPGFPPEAALPPFPDIPPDLPPELDLPPGPGPFPFEEFAALQALLAEIEAGLRDLQRQLADLPPPPPGFAFELPSLPSLPPLPDPWAFL